TDSPPTLSPPAPPGRTPATPLLHSRGTAELLKEATAGAALTSLQFAQRAQQQQQVSALESLQLPSVCLIVICRQPASSTVFICRFWPIAHGAQRAAQAGESDSGPHRQPPAAFAPPRRQNWCEGAAAVYRTLWDSASAEKLRRQKNDEAIGAPLESRVPANSGDLRVPKSGGRKTDRLQRSWAERPAMGALGTAGVRRTFKRISATASQPERSKPGQKKIEDCGSKSGPATRSPLPLELEKKRNFPAVCSAAAPGRCGPRPAVQNSSSAVTAGVLPLSDRGLGGFSRSSWGRAALSSARLSDFPAGSAPASLSERQAKNGKCSGAKLVSELAPRPMERSHLRPCSRVHIHHYHFHETQLANGRLARRAIIRSSSRHSTQLPVTPGCPTWQRLGPPIGRDGAGRDLRAAAIGPEPLHELGGPGCLACEQPETRQSQHSYIDLRRASRTRGEIIPPIKLNSAEPPRQPAYPALFYPAAAAAAWDFRSGGTGGGAGGSATSAAAAAAAAALLESRQPHQHHGHPQHPALHPQHPQHHHPRPAAISRNPFDPQSRIPLPHPFGEFHFGCESSFIRRRNERERERVRFVEILKTAIRYIQHMESLLRAADQQQQAEPAQLRPEAAPPRPELQAEPQEKRLRPA
uniref:BHLH domain-containing protein n=1 Tax=Macrostomum lignano TaxID=282301 RepID=A0A1I8FT44_9PLAT